MSTDLDFIPRPNPLFNSWQTNFVNQVNLFKSGWNWNSDAVTEWATLTSAAAVPPAVYGNKQAAWIAYWAIVASKEFKHSDDVNMKQARKSYESGEPKNLADTSIRIFITRYISHNKNVTPGQKQAMGLTVNTNTITHATGDATSRSIGNTGITLGLKKQIHNLQEIEVTYPGTKSKKKRHGVKEVMMYCLILPATAPKPLFSALLYVGDVKRGYYTALYTDAQEGMKAWYGVVEKTTKGKFGVPSAVFGVVIS